MALIDIVSVYHKEDNLYLFEQLVEDIVHYGDDVEIFGVDNREINRGFAAGCNLGASLGSSPIIGFINPDCSIEGPFAAKVAQTLEHPKIKITGCRFNKPDFELSVWGCHDWVCGAAFFVKRDFFESLGGFDDAYAWGWEETDFIRQAQEQGFLVRSIDLPILHESPSDDRPEDVTYKRLHFERGARRFRAKWA